jgi:hypothetical protein
MGIRFDPYAAVPSMHVGWSFLVALAGFRAARRRAVRVAFALHPLLMALTVAATGNHFFFDALGGLAVAGMTLGLLRLRDPAGARDDAALPGRAGFVPGPSPPARKRILPGRARRGLRVGAYPWKPTVPSAPTAVLSGTRTARALRTGPLHFGIRPSVHAPQTARR